MNADPATIFWICIGIIGFIIIVRAVDRWLDR